MSSGSVVRCICHSCSFEEIKAYVEEEGISSIGELQKQDICSNGCGLCIPYIKIMLQTGQTTFYPGEPFQKKSTG